MAGWSAMAMCRQTQSQGQRIQDAQPEAVEERAGSQPLFEQFHHGTPLAP
jgi:hypothetical protein